MPRKIKVAAVQMDAQCVPTPERLARAARLVAEAAAAGADLVALPEIFNTGYCYSDENYQRAEPLDGKTVAWMRTTAARHSVHLAGSLMLREGGEVFNALLLFAPDGRMWRYDKTYPWGWERAYFRGRRGVSVAHTDLGDIGLLICWDAAHRSLWRAYAGQVDLMLIASSPPDVTNPTFVFENDESVTFDDFGLVGRMLQDTGKHLFGEMVNQQTAWLSVPTVQTVASGHLRTVLPAGRASLLTFLPAAPALVRHWPHARQVALECDFIPGCKVVNAEGHVLSSLAQSDGEAFTVAEIALADEKPHPRGPQPKSLLPALSYLLSDGILPALTAPVYRRGVRQVAQQVS